MIVVASKRGTPPAGLVIDTTSHAAGWSCGLSPMRLGPCPADDGLTARTVEQLWQFSKVYPAHVREDRVTPAWAGWRAAGLQADRADRFPMGRGTKPLFSLWNGQRLGYIEARRAIYFPAYRDTLRQHRAWSQIKNAHQAALHSGRDLVLLDFDGYDHHQVHHGYLGRVLRDERRILGHAFVIAAMLEYGPDVTPADLD